MRRQKVHKIFYKVAWIYIFAFALFAFSFHSEAQEDKKTEATKEENKKDASKPLESSKEDASSEKSMKSEKKKKDSKKKAAAAVSKTKKGKKMIAEFQTNMGTFKIQLFPDKVPNTVENFAGLAEGTKEWTHPKTKEKMKKPMYDGVIFHRIIDGFMIQGGDPLGTGTGEPGYTFKDEFDSSLSNKRGTISMANRGPNTNGCQFFINTVDNSRLDNRHAVFGEVIEGMDIVDKISKVKTLPGDRPVEPVVINKLKILRQ